MITLILYLRGQQFASEEIELPEIAPFESRFYERERLISDAASELKMKYLRQIIKCQYDYEIYFVAESMISQPIL